MSITDNERIDIFSRIGQLEGARATANEISQVKNKNTNGSDGAKAFASILVIISIIGGMASIITPIKQQIDFMSTKVDRLMDHASDGHPQRVEAQVERTISMVKEHAHVSENIRTRINSLEQKQAVSTQQMNDGTKDRYYARDAEKDNALRKAELINLSNELNNLKEAIKDNALRQAELKALEAEVRNLKEIIYNDNIHPDSN